jgi:hypothetical protein
MKAPIFRRDHQSRTDKTNERGVTIILLAFSMVGILAMAVLSIDVITLYLARLEAQRSADAAALTAARILSISGITGDPNNSTLLWTNICGGTSSPASQAAVAIASQNTVAGTTASTVTVNYSAGGSTDMNCSSLPGAFGVNPMVTVQVQRTSVPTFFSRMWGRTGNTVVASATAEAFNPSNSGTVGNTDTDAITPVQPRCVKPWIVPNSDPGTGATFVDLPTGAISTAGIRSAASTTGEVGESFTLIADCGPGSTAPCAPPAPYTPLPNIGPPPPLNNLQYLPGQVPTTFTAVPSCGGASDYQKAVAGCDQTTLYHCGVKAASGGGYNVDLSNNPSGSGGDSAAGAQCLIHQATLGSSPTDADSLDTSAYPFQIKAGSFSSSSTGMASGTVVSSSNSIVSLPIYDKSPTYVAGENPGAVNPTGTTNVTIVGFLQVFINYVDIDGTINVTVLNVAGCGNVNTPRSAVSGSSPVPVRLIKSP